MISGSTGPPGLLKIIRTRERGRWKGRKRERDRQREKSVDKQPRVY